MNFKNIKHHIAQTATKMLLGPQASINAEGALPVAGIIVFWYVEDGNRHFVMVRDDDQDKSRFVGFFGTESAEQSTITTLHQAVKAQLGKAFYRALGDQALREDTIAAAPSYPYTDAGRETQLQMLIWAVQITPEQAQLAAPAQANLNVLAVPEFALLTGSVIRSHKAVYGSILNHLQSDALIQGDALMDQLEDSLAVTRKTARTIH